MNVPRQCQGENTAAILGLNSNIEIYYKSLIYVLYLSYLISSPTNRFSDDNTSELFNLQPANVADLERDECIWRTWLFSAKIDNWYDFCCTTQEPHLADVDSQLTLSLTDLLSRTDFFPAIRKAILIALTSPSKHAWSSVPSVCDSSTLVYYHTINNERLYGLRTLIVHRQSVNINKTEFMNKVIDISGRA